MKLQVRTLTRQRTAAVIPQQRSATDAPVAAPTAAPTAPVVPEVQPVLPAAPSVSAATPVEVPVEVAAPGRWHLRHSWELTSGRDGLHPRKVCTTCGKDVGLGKPLEANRWATPEQSLHGYRL